MDGNNHSGIILGKGRGRLTGDQDDMRRPRTNVRHRGNEDAQTSHNSDNSVQNIIPELNNMGINAGSVAAALSVDAPIFVPSHISAGNSNNMPADSIILPGNSNNLPGNCNNLPGNFSMENSNNLPIEELNSSNTESQNIPSFCPQMMYMEHPVILTINDLVVKLTVKPHKYDQIATQMTSILNYKVNDPNLMKEVISVIFEQGVGESNFRFNGGRLCHHLCRNVNAENPSFKTLLLNKCQEEHSFAEYYLQADLSRLIGFTFFLADIFSNLTTPAGNHSIPLRRGLCELLLTLMSNPDVVTMKCVAQVLKCSGKFLDKDCQEMESVMVKLRNITVASTHLPSHIQQLLMSVIELRANNWGQDFDQQVSNNAQNSVNNHLSDNQMGTVYFNPQGTVNHVGNDAEDSSSDTEGSFCGLIVDGQDEVDEELIKDFEDFLMSQRN